jgi:hypothetical protein
MTTTPPIPAVDILPETTDTRPEPPKMPDLWIIRWQEWRDRVMYGSPRWETRTSMFPIDNAPCAENEAAVLVAKGARRVQVIKIGGDA